MEKQPLAPSAQAFYITPLTPVHIESSIEFELSHYFIEEGWLYYFDPTRDQQLLTAPEREELRRWLAQTRFTPEQSCALQRFFYERRQHFKAATTLTIPVAHTVEHLYLQRVGAVKAKQERPVTPHRLIIDRHMFDANTLEPLILGSLLKAPLRSACFHALHPKQTHSRQPVRQREHFSDPLEAMHIQHATGVSVARKVLLCTNSLNKPAPKSVGQAPQQGPLLQMSRREMIAGGQYRALRSEWVIDDAAKSNEEKMEFTELAKIANAYFRPKFNVELHQMEQQGYSNNSWFQHFKQLFNNVLRQAMEEGRVMLLRMGQTNARGQLLPTAAWFGFHEDRDTLFPLGWVIVEAAETPALPELKEWCDKQSKPDSAPLWKVIRQVRELMGEKLVAVKQIQQKEREKAAEKAQINQAKQQALEALTAEQRKVEEFALLLESSPAQSNTGTPLFQQCWSLLQEALNWTEQEQKECEKRLAPLIKVKFPHLGKREKETKACLKQLRHD